MEINVSTYGQYWDAQAVAQYNILSYFPPAELTRAEFLLTDRLAQLEAGRMAAKNHPHIERKLHELDPCLRLRWEFEHPDGVGMWAIDRYVKEYRYHFCLFYWSHKLGTGEAIKAILVDSDMQSTGYHEKKKKYQEYALLRNDKLRSEIALAAIDSMSRSQLRQMIEVEGAIASGEKIRSYGRDADILNKMHANTKKLDALLHDRASNAQLEQVIGEQVKMADTDPNIVIPQ